MDYPTLPIGFQTGHPLEGPGMLAIRLEAMVLGSQRSCQRGREVPLPLYTKAPSHMMFIKRNKVDSLFTVWG